MTSASFTIYERPVENKHNRTASQVPLSIDEKDLHECASKWAGQLLVMKAGVHGAKRQIFKRRKTWRQFLIGSFQTETNSFPFGKPRGTGYFSAAETDFVTSHPIYPILKFYLYGFYPPYKHIKQPQKQKDGQELQDQANNSTNSDFHKKQLPPESNELQV